MARIHVAFVAHVACCTLLLWFRFTLDIQQLDTKYSIGASDEYR